EPVVHLTSNSSVLILSLSLPHEQTRFTSTRLLHPQFRALRAILRRINNECTGMTSHAIIAIPAYTITFVSTSAS
ncbi:unnamed protein product, partial [Mycena citricolor]